MADVFNRKSGSSAVMDEWSKGLQVREAKFIAPAPKRTPKPKVGFVARLLNKSK